LWGHFSLFSEALLFLSKIYLIQLDTAQLSRFLDLLFEHFMAFFRTHFGQNPVSAHVRTGGQFPGAQFKPKGSFLDALELNKQNQSTLWLF
jgi:hypothetical protein